MKVYKAHRIELTTLFESLHYLYGKYLLCTKKKTAMFIIKHVSYVA